MGDPLTAPRDTSAARPDAGDGPIPSDRPRPRGWTRTGSAVHQTAGAAAVGLVGGVLVGLVAPWETAIVSGWDLAAVTLLTVMWSHLLTYGTEETRRHAVADDPGRPLSELIVLAAGVALLADVAFILRQASGVHGAQRAEHVALGVLSVVVTWGVVHTVFSFRYARAHFAGTVQQEHQGGVDFNESEAPDYRDFAYLAFTVGMTFQVSDTDLRTKAIRRIALGHALISYLFGAVIVAMSINLVASLLQ